MKNLDVEYFRYKRGARLKQRGAWYRFRKDAKTDDATDIAYMKYRQQVRMDKHNNNSEDEENNSGGGGGGGKGGGGGSHGNTRLPYGLCKAHGIDLPDGATPRDAWDALKGIGISAEEEYAKLKEKGKVEITEVEKKPEEKPTEGGSGAPKTGGEPEKKKVERDYDKYKEVRIKVPRVKGGTYQLSYLDKDMYIHHEEDMTLEELKDYLDEKGIDRAKISDSLNGFALIEESNTNTLFEQPEDKTGETVSKGETELGATSEEIKKEEKPDGKTEEVKPVSGGTVELGATSGESKPKDGEEKTEEVAVTEKGSGDLEAGAEKPEEPQVEEPKTEEPVEEHEPKVVRDYDKYSKVYITSRYLDPYVVTTIDSDGRSEINRFNSAEEMMQYLDERGINSAVYSSRYLRGSGEDETSLSFIRDAIAEDKKQHSGTVQGGKVGIDCIGVPSISTTAGGYSIHYKDKDGNNENYTLTPDDLIEFLDTSGLNSCKTDGGAFSNPGTLDKYRELVSKAPAIEYGGKTYSRCTADGWHKSIMGTDENGRVVNVASFESYEDRTQWLKEQGIKEIPSIQDSELLVMDDEPPVADAKLITRFGRGKYYTGIGIGYQSGKYTVYGKGLDGKRETINKCATIGDAERLLKEYGVDKYKISPKAKEAHAETIRRFEAAKDTGYVELGGDSSRGIAGAKICKYSSEYYVEGETIKGMLDREYIGTDYDTAIKELKSMGTKKVMDRSGKTIDLDTYTIPPVVGKIYGRSYSSLKFDIPKRDTAFGLVGVEPDGGEFDIATLYEDGDVEGFEQKLAKHGLSLDSEKISSTPESKAMVEQLRKFKSESERYQRRYYTDFRVTKEDIGYELTAKDWKGEDHIIEFESSYESIHKKVTSSGIQKVSYDETCQKEKDKVDEIIKEFDKKATKFGSEKYADMSITARFGTFRIMGYDEFGDHRVVAGGMSDIDMLTETLKDQGYSLDDFPMDEHAKDMYAADLRKKEDKEKRNKRISDYIASGEYHKCGRDDDCFKDVTIHEDGDTFCITGISADDMDLKIKHSMTWDECIAVMEQWGIKEYKYHIGGEEYARPKDGLRNCVIEELDDGSYTAYGITEGQPLHEISKGTEEECRKYLKEQGVYIGGVKVKKPLSCDKATVDRSASKQYPSLANFDTYRRSKFKGTYFEDVSYENQELGLELMREVLTKGAYKVARSPSSFLGIIENGYKSQIETGTAGIGACKSAVSRKRASEEFFGHNGLQNNEYEKCGYIGFEDDIEDFNDYGHPWYGGAETTGIGDVTYTFKKDTMKDRTTYTFGDSLNSQYIMTSAGYDGDVPSIEGFTSISCKGDYNLVIKKYKEYKEGRLTYKEMFEEIRHVASNNYIELQYHGDVTVKDIDHATFQKKAGLLKAFSHGDAQKRKAVYKSLKENGVKLYYRDGDELKDAYPVIEAKYPDVLEA